MTSKRGWKIARLGLLTVAIVLVMAMACHASTVTGLTVTKTDNKVEIHVNATSPVSYQVLSTSKPRQALIVEMNSATVVDKAMKTVQIDRGIIERAKLQNYNGHARLVIELLNPTKYSIVAAPGNQGFILVMGTQTVTAKVSKAVPKMSAGEPAVETAEPVEPKAITKTNTKPVVKPVATKKVVVKPAPKTYVAATTPITTMVAQAKKPARAKKAPKIKAVPVKLVSIDFVNADLIYVLKLLARELNVNLVTDNTVTGSVTMSLKNVSAQTAMNIIVAMNGFKMKKMGNILFVGSEATMSALTPDVVTYQPAAGAKVEVIQLQYLTAADAMAAIKGAFPLVQTQASPQGNSIIVNADPKTMTMIREMIAGIDIDRRSETPVTEKTEVIPLRYTDATTVIPLLRTLLGADAPATIEPEPRLNALIVKGYEAQVDRVKQQLEEVDIPLQQVMLSVKVVDLSETGSKSLGINWQVGSQDGTQPVRWYEIPNNYPNSPQFTLPGATPFDPYTNGPPAYADTPIGFFIRDPFVLQSALAMQITQGEAKVLASPRVATVSNKEATLHIGDKYPIVYYDPRAGQYQVIYVDIGIKLVVKPTVSPDGYITTDINTTVSDLRELVNNQYPRTTERTATLNIRVKDNNTIVIGGMLREDTRSAVRKVPLLGDIPVLGQLFRANSAEHSKGEVIIMITPKIITQ